MYTYIDLTARDVAEHMDVALHSHLLLAIKRVKEQQDVIIQLNSKVVQLEQNQLAQEKALLANTIELTAIKGQMLSEIGALKNAVRK